jgi:hypothetical protein
MGNCFFTMYATMLAIKCTYVFTFAFPHLSRLNSCLLFMSAACVTTFAPRNFILALCLTRFSLFQMNFSAKKVMINAEVFVISLNHTLIFSFSADDEFCLQAMLAWEKTSSVPAEDVFSEDGEHEC